MAKVNPVHDEKQWAVKVSKFEVNDGLQNLTNTQPNKVIFESLAYSILIPIFSILLSSGFTLVPQHDMFDQPEYWYEIFIPWTSLIAALVILQALRMNVIFKELEFVKWPKTYIKMFLIFCFAMHLALYVTHLFWTDFLGCHYPVPLLYVWAFFVAAPIMVPYFWWFVFPSECRNNAKTGKRIKWYYGWVVAFIVACYERILIMMLFLGTPLDIQPIWAIIIPVWRELELHLISKFPPKICDGNVREGIILSNLEVNCNFSAVLAICLGMYATDTSCYCILGVEFLIKIYSCYDIVKMEKRRKVASGEEKQMLQQEKERKLQDLALDEFVEAIMPLVYVAMVLVAYHGPNKAILGNVGCDKWKWKAIPNLTNFLIALFRMFIIDLLALPVTCFIMWKYVSVNFMKQLCRDVTNYWPYITAVAGGAVTKVQKINNIDLQLKYLIQFYIIMIVQSNYYTILHFSISFK